MVRAGRWVRLGRLMGKGDDAFALFDLTPELVELPKPPEKVYDRVGADKYAFLYTATAAGNSSGIHFAATVEDAKKWCSTPVSSGVLHGTAWAYFWTRIGTFVEYKAEYAGFRPAIDISKLTDNGTWDERIAAAGVTKIPLAEFEERFTPLGIDFI